MLERILAAMFLMLAGARAAEVAAWSVPEARGSYAVVVSRTTYALPAWRAVVDALRTKYEGACILFEDVPGETHTPLAELHPRYVAFVARPEEAGAGFVIAVHRLLRALDDDPYTDAAWSIVTGYTPEDALQLAQLRAPLVVRLGLGGTSALDLAPFAEGQKFDEGNSGKYWRKTADGQTSEQPAPADTTVLLVEALNRHQLDLFMTSGHATPDDWQIGYSHRDGQFRCADGQLLGLDRQGRHFPIRSPNPKLYLPSGNCLIGQIHQPNCMALAWLRSGGVAQMFGYVVPTFYGYAGWGVNDYFLSRPGSCTFAQAVLFNQLALTHELETRFPTLARQDVGILDTDWLDAAAQRLGTGDRDALGLLWDHNVLAFYGDPAWQAGFAKANLPWTAELQSVDDVHTLRLTTTRAGNWGGRPQVFALPKRLGPATIRQGGDLKPVITDDFVLLPLKGDFASNQTVEVVFRAPVLRARPTTAAGPPITSWLSPKLDVATRTAVMAAPTPYRMRIVEALARAGTNRTELIRALTTASDATREPMAYLIANMPDADLQQLSADFLRENVELAVHASLTAPWKLDLTGAVFLDGVLPYACINEKRERWRKEFAARCAPLVAGCKTPGAAALRLNEKIFPLFGVEYHASKRPKPDQSPSESIAAKFASCTGLTILLVDACRAVGVPARLVGTPQWSDRKGNHTWAEIWDGDRWRSIGAHEPAGLDQGWYREPAARCVGWSPLHAIYAASFRRTTTPYPLVWAPQNASVSALNITAAYAP